MIILIMGIAGSGKSTVGRALATALHCGFIEGDDYHPPANVAKMSRGIPLTDADRWPWLDALAAAMDAVRTRGEDAVVACSALKQSYRDRLCRPDVQLVYMKVSESLAHGRLSARKEHFFSPTLLTSQLATLEEPAAALTLDAALDTPTLVATVLAHLSCGTRSPD